jgi:hypothetical protein
MTTIQHFPPEKNHGNGEEDWYSDDGEDDGNDGGGMAAMIAAAASKRNKRVKQGGGKIKMRAVAPPPPAQRPPDKQDFATLAAAAASQRKNRIEASGGELKVTKVRDIPQEHASVFVNVAEEAAKMGRLTRANESVVEATSHRPEETDTWTGPGGLKNHESRRSIFERAIGEAAALGRMKTAKPQETTNYDNHRILEESDDEIDIDKQVDEHGRRALRTHFLLDQHVREEYQEKKNQWSAPESFEEPDYANIDDVILPTEQLPSFKPKDIKFTTQREAMDSISRGVAAAAWDRNFRLQRPKAQLKVTRGCKCPYCKNPNPYQTHKYKAMMSGGYSSNDDLSSFPTAPEHHDQRHKGDSTNLGPMLEPPKGKIYRLANPNDDEKAPEEEEDPPIPVPARKWEPPNRPKVSDKSESSESKTCSIYKIQPAGDLRPVDHPDLQHGFSEENPDVLSSVGVQNLTYTVTSSGGYHASSHTGTKVLLNEYVDFGTRHKKVHIKRERIKKDAKKKNKPEKSRGEEGCSIM